MTSKLVVLIVFSNVAIIEMIGLLGLDSKFLLLFFKSEEK